MAHAEETDRGLGMAHGTDQASTSGGNQAETTGAGAGTAAASLEYLEKFTTTSSHVHPFKPEEKFPRIYEKVKEAKAMPDAELSEVLKGLAQKAVDANWTMDAPIKVLSHQGLEAGYRAYQGTMAAPPQMGPEEFGKRMHTFGVRLFYQFLEQEAFNFNHAWCHSNLDRFPEELRSHLGTLP